MIFGELVRAQEWLHDGALDALNAFRSGGVAALPALLGSAFLFGLLHALLPGHGKAVLMTFYAADGRIRSAAAASAVLILVHVGVAVALVLTGAAILQRTLVGAGRAPALEIASQSLIAVVGVWLIFRALRPHRHASRSGPVLGAVTGLVPCRLTTFIMTYAVANGATGAGLGLSAAFALGMIATVAVFPVAAILLRDRLAPFAARLSPYGRALAMGVGLASGGIILLLGIVPLLSR